MQFDQVPMPPRITSLPKDARGYPIPAITPRDHTGLPTFAVTGAARALICAVEGRCSICGTPMAAGLVWRVLGAEEAAAATEAISSGRPFVNRAASPEPPGHRSCMLYAAVVCPFLARPNARRRLAGDILGLERPRGEARGEVAGLGGAVAGFVEVEFRYVDGEQPQFSFSGLREFLPHGFGAEQVAELIEALAAGTDGEVPPCPPYLLDDEALAEAHAKPVMTVLSARS